MLRHHNDLDGRIIADIRLEPRRERELQEAHAQAWVGVVGGTLDVDAGHHDLGHVGRDGAVAYVDAEGRQQ